MLDTLEILFSAYAVSLSTSLSVSGLLYKKNKKETGKVVDWLFSYGTIGAIIATLPFIGMPLAWTPKVLGYTPIEDKVLETSYDVALETVEITNSLGLERTVLAVSVCSNEPPFDPCSSPDTMGSVHRNVAGMFVVELNKDKDGNNRYTLRHEIAHVIKGDCEKDNSRFNSDGSFNIAGVYFDRLFEQLWEEPRAEMFALYGWFNS
jgi:hypothetical protein